MMMNTVVNCKLNGKNLKVTNNAVEIEDSFLQIELVKRLIECKALTPVGESSLPLFFNKYLRKYEITEVLLVRNGLHSILSLNLMIIILMI